MDTPAPPHEIRALFLRAFVRQLMLNHPAAERPTIAPFHQESPLERINAPLQQTIPATNFNEYQSSDRADTTESPLKIRAIREVDELPRQPARIPVPQNQQHDSPTQFDYWLHDTALESIECPGPDKSLILKKREGITRSNTYMTNEEIKKLIKELADKAGTRVQDGILKADTPTWSAIATISEFGGNRFLIQKKRLVHP